MRPARLGLALTFILASIAHNAVATPKLTVGRAQITRSHATKVRSDLRRLKAAGVPAYLVASDVSARPAEHVWTRGNHLATVVAGVNPATVGRWMENIGQHSIGLIMGYTNHWSGHVRVGERFYHHKQARGTISTDKKGVPEVPALADYRAQARNPGSFIDQVTRPSGKWGTRRHVEVTVTGSKAEVDAVQAFYTARFHRLIRSTDGRPVMPKLKISGDCSLPADLMGAKPKKGQPDIVGGFGNESCSGTASAFANEAWQTAFAENLESIRAYGQEHGISELSSITSATVTALKSIASRINGQQDFAKYLAYSNYGDPSNMMTMFNTEADGAAAHTSETLAAGRTWSRARNNRRPVSLGWAKMMVGPKGAKLTQPDHAILDRPASVKATPKFRYVQSERMPLESALAALDAALQD